MIILSDLYILHSHIDSEVEQSNASCIDKIIFLFVFSVI